VKDFSCGFPRFSAQSHQFFERTRASARSTLPLASSSEIIPGDREIVGRSWRAWLPGMCGPFRVSRLGHDSRVPPLRVALRRRCESGTTQPAVIRIRWPAESESAGSFDPRRKGSDRTGPKLLLPASTSERARRDHPAKRSPFAMETRKGPQMQNLATWRVRAWQSARNLLRLRRREKPRRRTAKRKRLES
jgi:hypothetical protein